MPTNEFNIIFDQNEGPYKPGQFLTGKLKLFLYDSVPVSKIKIKFVGRADVAWSETEEDETRKLVRVRYQSHEQYFKSKFILYERQGDVKVPPGDHVYPFEVLVPKNIPSSFTSAHGKIQYFAIAKLQISGKFNKTKKEFFNVKNFLDLNHFQILKAPIEENKSKKFYIAYCLPCGKLTASVCIPRSGFVSNETIPLILEINNESSVSLRKITAYVVQKIEWQARCQAHYRVRNHNKRKISTNVLKSFRLGSAASNASETIVQNVPIPEKDFPYLENCHIISLKHELWIEADPGIGHCDLDISLPITIGDIGFNQDEPNDDCIFPPPYKNDSQISDFEFKKNIKLEASNTHKPSDTKSVEKFTSNEKY